MPCTIRFSSTDARQFSRSAAWSSLQILFFHLLSLFGCGSILLKPPLVFWVDIFAGVTRGRGGKRQNGMCSAQHRERGHVRKLFQPADAHLGVEALHGGAGERRERVETPEGSETKCRTSLLYVKLSNGGEVFYQRRPRTEQ